MIGAGERDHPPARQGEMGHRPNNLLAHLPQIDRCRDIERNRIELRHAEQLFDKPVHPRHFFSQGRDLSIAFERIEPRGDD